MKKQIISIIILVFIIKISNGQNWEWARHIGSNYPLYGERVNSLISDGTNYYAIGSFGGTLYLPGDTIYCNGENDMFIIKFDNNGNKIWINTFGGNYSQPDAFEDANGVFDPIHNCIYIAGTFINSVTFSSSVILNSAHINDADVFIAKMYLNGNFIWAKKGGSIGNDKANVFIEPNGDALLVGILNSSGNMDTVNLVSGGFFARYNNNGILKWTAHKFSGIETPRISFLGSDIIMAGTYNSNPAIIDTSTLIPIGSYDGYITRMDSTGKIKWIKKFGSHGLDGFSGICTNNLNNIYAVGFFNDTITLNGTTTLSNAGNDILITKFNQNGGLVWAKQTHANGSSQEANAVISDLNGNIYVTGIFEGSASFGNNNISTTDPFEMFIARYDSSGNCYGVMHFGQAGGSCIVQSNSSHVICSGAFVGTVNIGDTTFTSFGQQDIFIAKTDILSGIKQEKSTNNLLIIYANPTTGKRNITVPDDFLNEKNLTLSIFNTNGQLIQQKKLEMNDGKIKLNLEEEAKGIYNVTLSDGKKVYSGKIVFE